MTKHELVVIKYIKKPIIIEAIFYDGSNIIEILSFIRGTYEMYPEFYTGMPVEVRTLEGNFCLMPGNYLMKGVDGEFYPCGRDIFEENYEKA